jgi:deazaflavin-dependent oxidoreductase (nitroreductase family)
MRRLVAGLLALALPVCVGAEPTAPDIGAALAAIANGSNIEITTVGRRSGKKHARPIWFVVEGSRVYVQAGKDGKTDWYQNLLAKPSAELRYEGYTFLTRATPVTDPARVERIHALFLDKYRSAWLLSFLGSSIGRGKPVELLPESVTVAAPPSAR